MTFKIVEPKMSAEISKVEITARSICGEECPLQILPAANSANSRCDIIYTYSGLKFFMLFRNGRVFFSAQPKNNFINRYFKGQPGTQEQYALFRCIYIIVLR